MDACLRFEFRDLAVKEAIDLLVRDGDGAGDLDGEGENDVVSQQSPAKLNYLQEQLRETKSKQAQPLSCCTLPGSYSRMVCLLELRGRDESLKKKVSKAEKRCSPALLGNNTCAGRRHGCGFLCARLSEPPTLPLSLIPRLLWQLHSSIVVLSKGFWLHVLFLLARRRLLPGRLVSVSPRRPVRLLVVIVVV